MTSWEQARDAYFYDNKNREQTLEFQSLFRQDAGSRIEAWFRVVEWKSPRSAAKTKSHIMARDIEPKALLAKCEDYIEAPSLDTFREFRQYIAKSRNVATALTFPAFLRPDLFPMVDTQTWRWASLNGWSGIAGVDNVKGKTLQEGNWEYIKAWIGWCGDKAQTLGDNWTPRDVEMAVFTAQRQTLTLPKI